jgi:hypothetical protein
MSVYLTRKCRPIFGPTLLASCLLSGALAAFFILNTPVNAAIASWTSTTFPSDWSSYRMRWELGHALSFVLVLVGFVLLLRALFLDAIIRTSPRRNAQKSLQPTADSGS